MNIRRKIDKILDLLDDYLDIHDYEQIFRDKIAPVFIECYEYLDNIAESEKKCLSAVKNYWLFNGKDIKELSRKGVQLSDELRGIPDNISSSRLFSLSLLAIPFEKLEEETDGNFLVLISSALINAGLDIKILYDKLLAGFHDIIDIKEIEAPVYSDCNSEYSLIDYRPYNSNSFEMRKLLYRSSKDKKRDYNIDIVFEGVSTMIIPAIFKKGIVIDVLDKEEDAEKISELIELYNFNNAVNIYTLRSGNHTYYIDASSIYIYHNTLGANKSCLDNLGKCEMVKYHMEVQE